MKVPEEDIAAPSRRSPRLAAIADERPAKSPKTTATSPSRPKKSPPAHNIKPPTKKEPEESSEGEDDDEEEDDSSEEEEEETSTAGGVSLAEWLEDVRLVDFQSKLEELGAESVRLISLIVGVDTTVSNSPFWCIQAGDLSLLTEDDLKSVGMKVLHIRRFMAKINQKGTDQVRVVNATGPDAKTTLIRSHIYSRSATRGRVLLRANLSPKKPK